jgi:large subunit ribosomal protein L30
MGKITVTWKKSTIGFPQDQRRTIVGLGLKRLHHTVEHDDTPSILGMVNKVRHLVEVSEVAEPAKRSLQSTTRTKASKKKDETA